MIPLSYNRLKLRLRLNELRRRRIAKIAVAYILVLENDLNAPYYARHDPKLASMHNGLFKATFRMENYYDFCMLFECLEVPSVLRCDNGSRVKGIVGFAAVMCRLAYPCRWISLVDILGRETTQLSRIYNATLNFLYAKHCHRLESLDQPWLTRQDVDRYAAAVEQRSGRYGNCWGFIDGTGRDICRPVVDQRDFYSGHSRTHNMKWQSIVAPDGLIINFWGPVEGRHHDGFMLAQSNMIARLKEKNREWGKIFCIFGDRGYSMTEVVQRSLKGAALTQEELDFNSDMASCRIIVENCFGNVDRYFAFNSFKYNQKLYWQQVGTSYIVAALLTNCRTCIYGYGTAKKLFNLDPPSLEEYLTEP